MNAKPTPESILHDIAQILRIDRGTINVIRQGPRGPYHNHQCYEKGRNVSRYVPQDQVTDLKQDIDGYHRFQQLVEQYVQLLVERTRAERESGSKKRPASPTPSGPRPRNPAVDGPIPSRTPRWRGRPAIGDFGAHR